MSRNANDLAYTESKSRPAMGKVLSRAGISSPESKAIQDEIEKAGRIADEDNGDAFPPQGTMF